jgi:hypothetical protein
VAGTEMRTGRKHVLFNLGTRTSRGTWLMGCGPEVVRWPDPVLPGLWLSRGRGNLSEMTKVKNSSHSPQEDGARPS